MKNMLRRLQVKEMRLETRPQVLSLYRNLLKEATQFGNIHGDRVAASLLAKDTR